MKYRTQPRRYAEGTTVSVVKSRQDLEVLLRQHGATQFSFLEGDEQSIVVYRLSGRHIKHVISRPKVDVKRTSKGLSKEETELKRGEKEYQRRWRALLLLCKAKLEMIATGGSTFEAEFLSDTLLSNGETVSQAMLPRVAQMYISGQMPSLLLGAGQ